jgi:hypothetical protein
MVNQANNRRDSIAPAEASRMDDADVATSIAVLQSIQEERKKPGRPKGSQSQKSYAAATAAAAPSSSSSTVPSKKTPKATNKQQKEKTMSNAELCTLVRSLQTKLAASESRIEALEQALKSKPAPTPRQQLQVVNLAVRDSAERERRASNIIIRGLQPATGVDDSDIVSTFLQSACKENAPVFTAVRRLRTKVRSETETNESEQLACPILVSFSDTNQSDLVLRCAPLRSAPIHGGAFAHEDRTPAQQQQFLDCSRVATKRNGVLASHSLLRHPFLWVVRGDRVRCTDADKSSLAQKSVYVPDTDVYAAIKSAKQKASNNNNNNPDSNESDYDTFDHLTSGHITRRHQIQD